MKLAMVAEVKNKLSEYLKRAEKEDIVITRSGKPTAVLHHLGEDEIEDYLLEHDPKFKSKIEKRWKNYLKEGGVEPELESLGKDQRLKIMKEIQRYLSTVPFQPIKTRIKRLSGLTPPLYRWRIGDYRVYCRIEQQKVVILSVLHKKDSDRWLGS